MTPADTMRAAVEALVKARGWHNGDGWRESPAAVEKLPWEKLAWESQRDLLDSALSLLRSALSDDALRRAGAAGPLGDPDVLASPLPNEVLQLLNHIEDVVDDENWSRIDAKLWNSVAKLAAGVAGTQGGQGNG